MCPPYSFTGSRVQGSEEESDDNSSPRSLERKAILGPPGPKTYFPKEPSIA